MSKISVIRPEQVKWQGGPAFLPQGVEICVLEGDLNQASHFTARLKLPAHYKNPPHFHPVAEHITIISGIFFVGEGEEYREDETIAYKLEVGCYCKIPAHTPHFGWTKEETVLQFGAIGPWSLQRIQ